MHVLNVTTCVMSVQMIPYILVQVVEMELSDKQMHLSVIPSVQLDIIMANHVY